MKYEIYFTDGKELKINGIDINLHKLKGKKVVFDNLYINLEQVKYIVKKEEEYEILCNI